MFIKKWICNKKIHFKTYYKLAQSCLVINFILIINYLDMKVKRLFKQNGKEINETIKLKDK